MGSLSALILAALAGQASAGTNITWSIIQGAGPDWNAVNWSDGRSATVSAGEDPSNTYELLPGSRLRSPNNGTNDTFPGKVLTVSGSGVFVNNFSANTSGVSEIRFKQLAAGGIVRFPKLVMNGGQLDAGNDGTVTLEGEINVIKNAPIYNDGTADRGYLINAWLTGSASIEYRGYQANFNSNYTRSLNIAGTTNTYTGTWNVVNGVLLGSAPGSLGTNDITVGAQGALETTYDINNPKASLSVNGRVLLHQNHSFRQVTIGTTPLSKGLHSFAELNTSFPANFPATWTAQLGAGGVNTGSGSITVLEDNTTPVVLTLGPISSTNQPNTTATFTAAVTGPVNGIQWYANNVAISGANSLSYTTPALTLQDDGKIFKVVISNKFNSVTASATNYIAVGPRVITLSGQQGIGQNWDTAGFWSDGKPASVSAPGDVGNSYVLLPGSRLRSPETNANAIFPGKILTLNGNGVYVNNPGPTNLISELRFKQPPNTGVGGANVTFEKLVLNGGQLDLGNDGVVTIAGEINVAAKSFFNNNSANDRGFWIDAQLTGSGEIEYHGYIQPGFMPDFFNDLVLASTANTFSGKWNIVIGTVVGREPGSLGTNDITVGVNGGLQTIYDINNPNGSLNLQGLLFLHQNHTFRTVTVGTTPLKAGTYSQAQLASTFTNFPVTWTSRSGAVGYDVASGSITVLSDNTLPVAIATNPSNARVLAGQKATFTVAISGPASSIQWFANTVPIADATNLTYTTGFTSSSDDGTVYKVVVGNNVNSVEASATLVIGSSVISQGFLKNEVWFGTQYSRDSIQTTTDVPAITRYLTTFETPSSQGLNYTERVSGYFVPAVSGNYVFFVAADDDTDLYLSSDSNPANKVLIAREPAFAAARIYRSTAATPQNRSDIFTGAASALVAGQSYYIEAVHHQGAGGDNLAVTFKLVAEADPLDGSAPRLTGSIISAPAIDGATLSVTNSPQSRSVLPGQPVTFSVGVQSSSANIVYQWQRNGANISGATSSSYSISSTSGADDQAQFRVVLSIPGVLPVTSASAVLTVQSATANAPTIKNVTLNGTNLSFSFATQVGFTYQVDSKSALTNATWLTVSPHVGTGSDVSVTIPATDSARFFRVRAQ